MSSAKKEATLCRSALKTKPLRAETTEQSAAIKNLKPMRTFIRAQGVQLLREKLTGTETRRKDEAMNSWSDRVTLILVAEKHMKNWLLELPSCADQRRNQLPFEFASRRFRDTCVACPSILSPVFVTARSVCPFHRHPSLRSQSFFISLPSEVHRSTASPSFREELSPAVLLLRRGMPDQVLDLYLPFFVGWVSWRCCQ